MKVTVDRKLVLQTLKALRGLSSKSPSDEWKDVVSLHAVSEGLLLSSGFGLAFLSVLIPAQTEEEGECHISYKILDLLKAAHDEQVVLKMSKTLVLSGVSGFRATLSDKVMRQTLPIIKLRGYIDEGVSAELLLHTDDLDNLVNISNAFTPTGSWKEINVVSKDGEIKGSIQGSEEGGLDSFPMLGEGDDLTVCLRPDYVGPLLSFCGDRVKLQTLNVSNGFVLFTDPDDTSWWALIVQIQGTNN